jgi:hypothetical protein
MWNGTLNRHDIPVHHGQAHAPSTEASREIVAKLKGISNATK